MNSSKTSSGLPTSVDVGMWLNLLVWAGRLYGSSALRVLWFWKRSTVPSCFWYFRVIQINPDSFHFTFHDKKGADRLPASRKTLAWVLSRRLRVYFTVVSPSREIHLCALKGQEWRSGGVHAHAHTWLFSPEVSDHGLDSSKTVWCSHQDSTKTWRTMSRAEVTPGGARRGRCDVAFHSRKAPLLRYDAKFVFPSRLISLQFCMRAPLKS